MTDCPRLGKFSGGCHFEARYDLGPANGGEMKGMPAEDMAVVLDATRPKTYVHDICVRCGKVVKRTPDDQPAGERMLNMLRSAP